MCPGTSGDAALRLRGNHFVGCLGDVTLSGNSGRVTSLELTHSKSAVQDGCPDHCHVTDRCDDVMTPRRCVNNYVTGSCDCSVSSETAVCQRGKNLNGNRCLSSLKVVTQTSCNRSFITSRNRLCDQTNKYT